MYNQYWPIFQRKIYVYLKANHTTENPTDFKTLQIINLPLVIIINPKMRILTTLVFLITILSFSNLIANNRQDYRKYHEQINKAEKYISKEQFREALKTCNKIFTSFDFVFLRDYKIAAQIALYLDDKKTVFEIIKKGIIGGWSLKSLKKDDSLSILQNELEWHLIEKECPEHRRKYLQRIDKATKDKVHEMYKKHQKKALGALFRIGDKAQGRYALKKFAPHSETQLKKLINILEDRGYPGEQLIGNNFWVSTI